MMAADEQRTDWSGIARREAAAIFDDYDLPTGREELLVMLQDAWLAGVIFGLGWLGGDVGTTWTDTTDEVKAAQKELEA